MNQLLSRLRYAGYDKDEFDALMRDAVGENGASLRLCTLFAAAFFFLLTFFNLFQHGISRPNTLFYALSALSCGVLYLCANRLMPSRPGLTMSLAYAFIATLYAFSLAVTALHPEQPAVTSIAVMLMAPFLFTDRPIHQIAMTAVLVAALCVLSTICKDYETA